MITSRLYNDQSTLLQNVGEHSKGELPLSTKDMQCAQTAVFYVIHALNEDRWTLYC